MPVSDEFLRRGYVPDFPKLDNALNSYNPEQQNQLKQALTDEISDLAGNRLKGDSVERLEDGRLSVELNRGLHHFTLDPQQILQQQQDVPRQPERPSTEEQRRRETQSQIQQQISQLTQHPPIDRLIMESRLREAVQDERIESLCMEGEDTFHLGLSNGMVLTATTYELLNMESGRELLQRSQTDPTTTSNQHDPAVITEDDIDWTARREEQAAAERLAMTEGQAQLVNEVGAPQSEVYNAQAPGVLRAAREEKEALNNMQQYGLHLDNKEYEQWSAGLQRSMKKYGNDEGMRRHFGLYGAPGAWMKDAAVMSTTGGSPIFQRAIMPQVERKFALGVTELSVETKGYHYFLNLEHQIGKEKAKWFEGALGFNKGNIDQLVKQVVFDEKKAVQTATTQYGVKYNQVISIHGANGRTYRCKFCMDKK